MNAEDVLIKELSYFGYPVRRQGSLLADESYPEFFFTFWNNSSNGEMFYDNDSHVTEYSFNVFLYGTDSRIYEIIRNAMTRLKCVGFILTSGDFDVPTDEPTHDGRGFRVIYKEDVKYE